MHIDFDSLKPEQIYGLMTQTIIPRPIAWVLTENRDGSHNLAPFSYFSAVSSVPPLVMISLGRKPDGSLKDTLINLQERQHCVVHIASVDQLDALNQSSAALDYGESEVKASGLATVAMEGSVLPRLKDCPVAFSGHLHQVIELGPIPQALVLIQLQAAHVADAAIAHDSKGRLQVHANGVNPLARLGATEYSALGRVLTRVRPA